MAFLGDLVVRLGINTAEFQNDMGKAVGVFQNGVRSIASAARSVEGKAAFAALGAAVTGAAAGFAYFAKDVVAFQASLDDMAESTGATVESLSKIHMAAQISGSDFAGITDALGKMVKGLKDQDETGKKAASALEYLGVSAKNADGTFKDTGQTLEAVAKALAKYEDNGNKVALAQDILGKGAARYLPLLKDMVADGERHARVTAEQAAKSEEFEKNIRRLEVAFTEGKRALVNDWLPGMNDLLEQLVAINKVTNSLAVSLRDLARIKILGAIGVDQDPAEAMKREEARIKFLRDRVEERQRKGASFEDVRPLVEGAQIAEQRLSVWRVMRAEQLKKDLEGQKFPEDNFPGKKANYLSPKTGGVDALINKQISALQSMEEKKKSLFNLDERQLMLDRITVGSYREFDAVTKKKLMAIAGEIDLRKELIDRVDADMRAYTSLHAVQEAANDSMRAYHIAIADANEERAFELSMIGKLTTEQERANAVRKIDLDLRRQLGQLADTYGEQDPEGLKRAQDAARAAAERAKKSALDQTDDRLRQTRIVEMGKMTEQVRFDTEALAMNSRELEVAQTLRQLDIQQFGRVLSDRQREVELSAEDRAEREKLIETIKNRQAVERDYQTGAIKGMRDYADAAMNAAANAESFWSKSFQSMEDALVDFVKNWKVDFKKLADSIISDLIRIQIRASITGPLAQAASGGGGIFGAISQGIGSLFGLGSSSKGMNLHTNWLGAPEFALGTDSVPETGLAYIHKGERIIPAGENAGAAANGPVFHVDMRGASVEAVQRLESFVMRMNGSIESRAVAAVFNENLRGNRP